MDYSFNGEIAAIYGVDEAVFIHNLYWWIRKNEANGRHYYDGRNWTYNSMRAFAEMFPFWTQRQLRRIIQKLHDNGAIHTGNYNTAGFDRTQWYALDEAVYSIYANGHTHLTKTSHAFDQNVQPIPDSKPYSKPDIATTATHARENLSAVCRYYEENMGGMIPRTVFDEAMAYLEDGMQPDLITEAIRSAAENNIRKWSYVRAILNRCKSEGILTASAFKGQAKDKPASKAADQESFTARLDRVVNEMMEGDFT